MQYLSFNIFRRKGFKRTIHPIFTMAEDKTPASIASTKTASSILKNGDTNSSGDTKSNKPWAKKSNGYSSLKPKKFQGVTKGLEDHYFYY